MGVHLPRDPRHPCRTASFRLAMEMLLLNALVSSKCFMGFEPHMVSHPAPMDLEAKTFYDFLLVPHATAPCGSDFDTTWATIKKETQPERGSKEHGQVMRKV